MKKTFSEITVGLPELTISVSSNNRQLVEIFSNYEYIKHLLPRYSLTNEPAEKEIIIEEAPKNTYSRSSDQIRLTTQVSSVSKGQWAHFFRHSLQYYLFQEGTVLIEGAAIGNEDSTALILGPSKSGKTALARAFGAEQYYVYGDDQICVNTGEELRISNGNSHVSTDNRMHSSEYTYEDSERLGFRSKSSGLVTQVILLQEDLFGSNPSKVIDHSVGAMRFYSVIGADLRSGNGFLFEPGLALPPNATTEELTRVLGTLKEMPLNYHSVTGPFEERRRTIESILSGT